MRAVLLISVVAACGGGGTKPTTTTPPPEPTHVVEPTAPTPVPTPVPPAPPKPQTLAEAGIVPEWMNRTADPCTDFFEYACGTFVKTAEIPADRPSWGAIAMVTTRNEEFLRDVLEKAAAPNRDRSDATTAKLGDFYAACMDEPAIEKAGTAPLAPTLAIVASVTDAKSLYAAVTQLHAKGISSFFSLGPQQDFADASLEIAGIDQGGTGLPDRDYYLAATGSQAKTRGVYTAHVERMFGLLGRSAKEAKQAAADVLRVETALAKLEQSKVERRDPHNVYHRVERAGLEAKVAPSFPWGAYLAGLGIPDVTAISVSSTKYLTGVAQLMQKEKPEALRAYLTWNVLRASAEYLPKAFQDERLVMQKELRGVTALPPRWRRCTNEVDGDLGELLGQAYVKAKFAGDSKARAVELTRAIFAAMRVTLDKLPWMDDATRGPAKQKLDKMAGLIGFPDTWRAYPFTVSRDDFFGNVQRANAFEIARQFAKIGKPVDHAEWQMTAPTVNAYYDSSLNEIVLPAGQLQPPFFGATFHPAVNFGSTGGGTIGHELTHGFDDEGSQFDASGNLRDWWTKPTKEKFEAATACVVEQYGKYEAVPKVKLNGKLTAGENIADIGGVKLGYEAYEAFRTAQAAAGHPVQSTIEDLTDDQVYFLAYGQSWCDKSTPQALESQARTNPHSPPRWRVNGVIVDQPGFGAAFKCPAKSPMNPGKACSVW